MRRFGAVCLAVLGLILASADAFAEKRAALVIGNSSYRSVPRLPNPANDAKEVAALFKASGFQLVETHLDLTIADTRRAVREFAVAASDADIAVVYFAGHGIEIDGANYVIPIDARLARDFDVEDETVSLDRILKAIEPAKKLRLVILDACRDNPFLKGMSRSTATRSIGRGLAKVEPTMSDTLVAFAAKAGSIALDGDSRNSPFTAALLQHIAAPGVDLRIAFGRVRDDVLRSTGRKQEPFVYGSLGGSIISIVDAPSVAPPPSADEIVWNAIKDSQHPATFAEFAAKFPASRYRAAAETRRDELQARAEALARANAADEVVWNAIRGADNPAIFADFAAKFPASRHRADADARREELQRKATAAAKAAATDEIVWSAIRDSDYPGIFADFIAKFPTSPHRARAEARRADLEKKAADAAAAAAAKAAAVDEIVWDAIRQSQQPVVFDEFLAKFPQSARAPAARARLDEIKRVAVAAFGTPPLQGDPASQAGRIDIGLRILSLTDEQALKQRTVFRECDRCPELVIVPAGTFMMGSPESEPKRESVEGPQRQVAIAKPFAVGRFAVTFEEWDTCVADGGCNGYKPWDNGWGRGKRPVINVSWHDAKSYVAWLSRRTGKDYRLLSEAEREYVTRAGTTTPYWWGASISRKSANFKEDAAAKGKGGTKGTTASKTMPVDSFLANPWGLFQVSGNIWEWVDDCLIENYSGAPADGTAWIKESCERRVLRGGSWISEAALLRSAGRYGVQPEGRVSNVGFRIARTLGSP